MCRHDHRLAQRDHVTVTALAEEDLIGWPAEFGLRRLVEDAFAAHGITPRIPYELAADFTFAAGLVRAGLGSVFMPRSETATSPTYARSLCGRRRRGPSISPMHPKPGSDPPRPNSPN